MEDTVIKELITLMSFGGVIVVKLSGVTVREPSVIVMGSNSALPKKGKAVS